MALTMNAGPAPTPALNPQVAATVFKWTGRGFAGVLFLLTGAFFVEHLNEWYLNPQHGHPPMWVTVGMILHFGMLLGLLLSLRWVCIGATLTVLATLGFMIETGLNTNFMPFIVLFNLTPVVCFAAWAMMTRRAKAQAKA